MQRAFGDARPIPTTGKSPLAKDSSSPVAPDHAYSSVYLHDAIHKAVRTSPSPSDAKYMIPLIEGAQLASNKRGILLESKPSPPFAASF
jgi:hypothetical protein